MKKGSYLLVIKMDEDKDLIIGKKGPTHFPGGFYCYVGSAMNNLEKRICRHMSEQKKNHWHIDWLLDHARITEVKSVESKERIECDLNKDVAEMADDTPVKGFGASDCRGCDAHLHFFREDPSTDLERVIEKWKSSSANTKR